MHDTTGILNPFSEGQVLLIHKDLNWTSFDVVNRIRKLITRCYPGQRIKVGHAGSLDPLATGLMIVCTGRYTRRIQEFMNMEKEYLAVIEMGRTTPSFDLETDYDQVYPYEHVTGEACEQSLRSFVGVQMQTPPAYSAKNVKGKKAYTYARQGKEIRLDPVKIHIREIELLEYLPPVIRIRVVCSRGTYLRVLAHDIGKSLGTGAHLAGLTRTRIGTYTLDQAISVGCFEKNLLKRKQM